MADDFWWWRADALCAQIGGELFFLRDGEPGNEAKRVCRMCPVRDMCLAESLICEDENGIWGGVGRDVRRRLAALIPARRPIDVARAYIDKENHDRRGARPRNDRSSRRAGDRLRPLPAGRPAERPAVEALRDGAQGFGLRRAA